jgi:hypothetical protein
MPNSQLSGLQQECFGLWTSINVSMEPFRAFVGDNLHENQRTIRFAMQSFHWHWCLLLFKTALDFYSLGVQILLLALFLIQ